MSEENKYKLIDDTLGDSFVSIAMIAYNHEKFIAQALNSVLMQKTKYKYKIVIAEDMSTDGTREILLDYQKRYPDKIKLILQNKNVGAIANNLVLLSHMEGNYIAALEGDDYWINPLKLETQIDFLEYNKDFVLSGHCIDKLKYDGEILKSSEDRDKIFTQSELYDQYIPTLSAVFRNVLKPLPIELNYSPSGDFLLWTFIGQFGQFHISKVSMGIYREHLGGAWSGVSLIKQLKNSVITRLYALKYVKDKKKTILYNLTLCKSGIYRSILNFDIYNVVFFIKKYISLKKMQYVN